MTKSINETEAIKRLERYGEIYRDYSGMASIAQMHAMLIIFLFALWYTLKFTMLLVFLFILINICQYMLGQKKYCDLFDCCALHYKYGNYDSVQQPEGMIDGIEMFFYTKYFLVLLTIGSLIGYAIGMMISHF